MSVYKPRKSPFYRYDFQLRGVRFAGSTECASKRDAEAFEKQRREEARVEVTALRAQEHAPLTFATAAARYYLQVGAHLRGEGPKNCMAALTWLAWISTEKNPLAPDCKRGKTRGGMIMRFTGRHELDLFWACRRPRIWTACRTPR